MMEVVEMPELMIYLRSSVPHLVKNIQKAVVIMSRRCLWII